MLTYGEPVWGPLERLQGAGDVLDCGHFMYMGSWNGIHLYKHFLTRRYLNLDEQDRAFRFTGNGYVEQDLGAALRHAYSL
jgi:hypothetical protein